MPTRTLHLPTTLQSMSCYDESGTYSAYASCNHFPHCSLVVGHHKGPQSYLRNYKVCIQYTRRWKHGLTMVQPKIPTRTSWIRSAEIPVYVLPSAKETVEPIPARVRYHRSQALLCRLHDAKLVETIRILCDCVESANNRAGSKAWTPLGVPPRVLSQCYKE